MTRSVFYRRDLWVFRHLSIPGTGPNVVAFRDEFLFLFFFFYLVSLYGTQSTGTHSCSAGDAVSPWPAWGSLDPCLRATSSPRKDDKRKGLVCLKCQCCTETSLFPRGSPRTKPFPASSLKHSVLICEIKSGSGSAVVICHKLTEKVDADIDFPLRMALVEFAAD